MLRTLVGTRLRRLSASRMLVLTAVLAVLGSLSVDGRASAAGDVAEMMKATNSEGQGGDPEKIRLLRERLREAERDAADRRRLGLREPAREAAAAPDGTAQPTAAEDVPPAAPAQRPSAKGADADAENAEKSDAEAPPKEPEPRVQPGCMYSGTKLIWERKPGTCH